jgi:hypothetical protein
MTAHEAALVRIDPALAWLARGALAALVASAAAHKLRDFAAFRVALSDYELVPWWLSGLAARALVAAELGIAAALLAPIGRPWGLGAAAALLALYTSAIAVNLARGRRDLDCGCFGPALRVGIGLPLVARNALWFAVALAGLLPVAERPLVWVDAVTVAGAVAALLLLHGAASQLLAQAPRLRALGARP